MLTCKQGITRSRGKPALIFARVIVVAGGVIAALLAAWVWSIGVAQAQENSAQGCGEPIILPVQPEPTGRYRFQQIAEPYDVRVDLYPSRLRIGTTVVGIYVWEASTCQPVTDATITLWTRHGEADEQKKVTANNIREESEPERYHAQMTLDAPGDWQVTIDISSDLGDAALVAPTLTVEEARQDMGGRWVFIAVLLVIISGAAYLWWSTQRRRRRLESGNRSEGGAGPDDGSASGPVS